MDDRPQGVESKEGGGGPPPWTRTRGAGAVGFSGRMVVAGMAVLLTGGCDAGTPPGAEPVPWSPPPVVESDGLLERSSLQAVAGFQEAGDAEGLTEMAADPDPDVRARAAFALASAGDSRHADALVPLLADPEPQVRRDAAFALGRLGPGERSRSELAAPLLNALSTEGSPEARLHMVEALGFVGDERAVEVLIEGSAGGEDPREEEARTLALGRLVLEGVGGPDAVSFLARRLTSSEAQVRRAAAHYFHRVAAAQPWAHEADAVREALDGYPEDDPVAPHLVGALWHLQTDPDRERALHWLAQGPDWRSRVAAVRVFQDSPWIREEEVQEALLEALEDPVLHVAVATAAALSSPFTADPAVLGPVREWMAEYPERWPAAGLFLDLMIQAGEIPFVLQWARDGGEDEPGRTVAAVRGLMGARDRQADSFLFDAARSDDPWIRGEALAALQARWRGARDTDELQVYYHAFRDGVRSLEPWAVYASARALAHPTFHPLGALDELRAAWPDLRERDLPPRALGAVLEALGQPGPDREERESFLRGVAENEGPVLRAYGLRALELLTDSDRGAPNPEEETPFRPVDWAALGQWGVAPRLTLETERGHVVLRLVPEEAPQTVDAVLHLAQAGRFDGTRFHRVVPGFVTQGGDVGVGHGQDGPEFRVRTELTRIPFVRGVVGMANSGRDTEGSQFFITHGSQRHLDAGYTAVGWVEEGMDVVDRIQEGDRIVRAQVEVGEP